ncbi:YNL320W [Zygosaccharomyces parabailii]|uniref:BN860_04654g1_1 n=1 Tax=Zygosaccharomyces bailii (strain CLIB 213 / ATCC 58445 / CBS 680 / BCRC 21525 / NBRC 1098 / NCYC 1416 / NRRL Y-2227) TaxID=1333698 RepID=A0A8J2X7Z9_ZYGB2|nr:YNL320W [Zygosaccharomyces parabailii]CDF87361.1 BN860_04654g1_1 [Zygosaccharomyces bailii CLIB 213]CDH15573.1 probable protein involved in cell growth [Zygosaccharomyces bailii ISA1307]SJM84983.1 related to protein bem46 [Zygosaccharomyces bailii]
MLWGLLKMLVGGCAALVSLSLAALYVLQNRLVYPSWAQGARDKVDTPDSYGLPYKKLVLTTGDGVKIEAYDMQNTSAESTSTVLILCPNAGNIGYFIPIADMFYRQMGLSVFIYSYRGYGHSEGTPSEVGLKKDADAVIQHLSTDKFHKSKKLILYGRSLGGANAIYISAKYSQLCDAVILENTFLSIREVIPYLFPVLKYFKGLCHDTWNSKQDIVNCDASLPFLFLCGLKDEIVPPSHMKKLAELCPSNNKQVFEFPFGYHNDTIVQDGYWDIIQDFLEQHGFI